MTQKKRQLIVSFFVCGWKKGFEPSTLGTTIRYSNQLSYIHHFVTAKIQFFLIEQSFYAIFLKIYLSVC